MKLNYNTVETRMAELELKIVDLADRARMDPSAMSRLLASVRENKDVKPTQAARLSKALKVRVKTLQVLPSPEHHEAA